MNLENNIKKIQFTPFDRIFCKDTNHNINQNDREDKIDYNDNKNNNNKTKIIDIEDNLFRKNLSGNKHYTKPLIKNTKIEATYKEHDIDINNFIRSEFSRLDTPIYQKKIERNDDMRFQYLTKNFQDPDKLVLPFPRGGVMTREKYSKNINK